MARMAQAAGNKAVDAYSGTLRERTKEDNIQKSIDRRIRQEEIKKVLDPLKKDSPLAYKSFKKLYHMWEGSGKGFVNHLMLSYAKGTTIVTKENCGDLEMKCALTGLAQESALTAEGTNTVLCPEAVDALASFSVTNPPRKSKKKK